MKPVFISKEDVTKDPVRDFHYVTEASDLELPVGQFPRVIQTNLGNGQPFVRQDDGQVEMGVQYRQVLGCISLTIFND